MGRTVLRPYAVLGPDGRDSGRTEWRTVEAELPDDVVVDVDKRELEEITRQLCRVANLLEALEPGELLQQACRVANALERIATATERSSSPPDMGALMGAAFASLGLDGGATAEDPYVDVQDPSGPTDARPHAADCRCNQCLGFPVPGAIPSEPIKYADVE